MSDNDNNTIFNATQTQQPEPAAEPQQAQAPQVSTVDYSAVLSDIKDAQGNQKYSDVETALKSINFASEHIQTLEAENAQYKENELKQDSAQDLIAQVQAANKPQTGATDMPSTEAITAMVVNAIKADKQQTLAQTNQAKVVSILTEKFGDKAEEQYRAKGQELGLGPQTLDDIAGSSPEAVLAWFGTDKATTSPQQVQSTVVPNTFQTQNKPEKVSVMGMTTDKQVVAEWDRIKKEVEAEFAAA